MKLSQARASPHGEQRCLYIGEAKPGGHEKGEDGGVDDGVDSGCSRRDTGQGAEEGVDGSYFNFRKIMSMQDDRRYAIQDRTAPHQFREIYEIPRSGYVK